MTAPARRGMMLPLAIAIVLVIAVMAGAVHLLSRQSYKALHKIDGFLRSVSVGEACFTRIVTRLQAAPWDARWFKGRPDMGSGAWNDGTYKYMIADGARPNEADLLVKAEADEGKVALFWRLRAEQGTVSPFRRVRTVVFTHADPDVTLGPPALGDISRSVDDHIRERDRNRPWVESREDPIRGATNPGDLPRVLGLPSPPPELSSIPPSDPGQPGTPPLGPRLTGGEPPAPTLPAVPPIVSGPQPAPPDAIQALALARRDLEDALLTIKDAEAALEDALGSSGERERLVQEMNKCCAGEPPPNTDCSGSNCACAAALAQINALTDKEFTPVAKEIWQCAAEMEALATEIDSKTAAPGPSDSDAVDMTRRANEKKECAARACARVGQLVSQSNALLKGCGAELKPKRTPKCRD